MDERGWNDVHHTGGQIPVGDGHQNVDSPFEEPEQAPELRADRSENLYSRDKPFWNRVIDASQTGQQVQRDANYWNHPDVMDTDRILYVNGGSRMDKLRRFLGSGAVKRFIAIVAVVMIVAVILYSALFQVRTITVVGAVPGQEQEIIRLSGIKVGQSSLTIDDESVMRKIESNRYLRCTLVDVQWDSVTIHVKTRERAAYMNHNGMVVVLDNRGYVLEETLDAHTDYTDLVKVIGLKVRRSALGQQISLTSASQLETYTQIMVELKAMKGLSMLRELDMSSMDSIYLATSDDPAGTEKPKILYVRLGSEDSIHEKLRAFMLTRDEVIKRGFREGTIDVTDPGRPTYSP